MCLPPILRQSSARGLTPLKALLTLTRESRRSFWWTLCSWTCQWQTWTTLEAFLGIFQCPSPWHTSNKRCQDLCTSYFVAKSAGKMLLWFIKIVVSPKWLGHPVNGFEWVPDFSIVQYRVIFKFFGLTHPNLVLNQMWSRKKYQFCFDLLVLHILHLKTHDFSLGLTMLNARVVVVKM